MLFIPFQEGIVLQPDHINNNAYHAGRPKSSITEARSTDYSSFSGAHLLKTSAAIFLVSASNVSTNLSKYTNQNKKGGGYGSYTNQPTTLYNPPLQEAVTKVDT